MAALTVGELQQAGAGAGAEARDGAKAPDGAAAGEGAFGLAGGGVP